jgi:phage terminase small subunit
MASPRPIPVRLKLLRGNPGKQRLGDVFDPPQPPEPPRPPEFLSGYALEEWNRVAPGLFLFGLLSMFDVHTLAAYCVAYQHRRTA